ncbi:MAG: ABC transporter ATP-binding protein [Bacteroidia bacterium]|nr:ABC transporter ATP-binding protein [Bacteroidia bacterium]
MKNYRKRDIFLPFLRNHFALVSITVMAGILSSLLVVMLSVSIGKFFELAFDYQSFRGQIFQYLPSGWIETPQHFIMFFFGLLLLNMAVEYLERYSLGVTGEYFTYFLREKLFQSQMTIPLRVYQQKGGGKYLLRWSADMKSIRNFLTIGIIGFVRDFLLLIVLLGVIHLLNRSVGGLVLLGLVLLTLVYFILRPLLKKASIEVRNRKSGLLAFVSQRIHAIGTIQAFNRIAPEYGKFQKKSFQLRLAGISYERVQVFFQVLASTGAYGILGLIMIWVYYSAKTDSLRFDPSSLLVVFLLLITAVPVLRRLLRVNVFWETGNISLSQLLRVLNQEENESEEKSLQTDTNPVFLVSGRTYWFSTPLGDSGTSFTDHLLMFSRHRKISLFLDEQPLDYADPRKIRNRIAVASDRFPLLGKTVFEAISYSRNPHKKVEAKCLLERLQENFLPEEQIRPDDPIGEMGKMFSTSRQKLLVIARALLSGRPVLILENPFEGLEPAAGEALVKELNARKGKSTLLILAENLPENLYWDEKRSAEIAPKDFPVPKIRSLRA